MRISHPRRREAQWFPPPSIRPARFRTASTAEPSGRRTHDWTSSRHIRTTIAAGAILFAQFVSAAFVAGWNTRRLIAGTMFGLAAIVIADNAWKSFGDIAEADPPERGELVALAALVAAVIVVGLATDWLYATYINLTR